MLDPLFIIYFLLLFLLLGLFGNRAGSFALFVFTGVSWLSQVVRLFLTIQRVCL